MMISDPDAKVKTEPTEADDSAAEESVEHEDAPREIGGRGGLDPTRYGDWEKAGRCIDF